MLNIPNPAIFALPIALVLLLLVIAIPLIIIYLFLRLTEAAFEQVGFDHWHASLAVFGSIMGSLLDIPLYSATIGSYPGWYIALAGLFVSGFQTHYHPFYLAINLGGAIIPLAISVHLVLARRVSALKAVIGIVIVTILTYHLAAPVPYQGIVLPFWISPALAAICGLVIARGYSSGAPALAYISGSIGTLLGADIMNLLTPGVLPALSPVGMQTSRPLVLSIGGAGVFDGIFLTGILAVLFAAFIVRIFHPSRNGDRMHRDAKRDKDDF
jgi:uncharacterized membrane protein